MKYIALVLCLVILSVLPASAEAELCYSRENAPYWHKNADCHFAETDWMDAGILGGETRALEVNQAESEGQKPCPGCAAEFPPTFTGDFPDWPHTLAPWGYEKGDIVEDDGWPRGAVELPPEVLSAWGMPWERLNELFPESWDRENDIPMDPDYPDDYAGGLYQCLRMVYLPAGRSHAPARRRVAGNAGGRILGAVRPLQLQ